VNCVRFGNEKPKALAERLEFVVVFIFMKLLPLPSCGSFEMGVIQDRKNRWAMAGGKGGSGFLPYQSRRYSRLPTLLIHGSKNRI
jgi:hypothetical protein